MKLEVERVEQGMSVHYEDSDVTLAARGREVLVSRDDRYRWLPHVAFPGGLNLGRWVAEPVERLTRGGIQFIKVVEADTFVCLFEGNLYRINGHNSKSRRLCALSRGRRTLRNGACVVHTDVLVGDYWRNANREAVRIHRVDAGSGAVSSFLTFPASKVRHVHLIQHDPYSNLLWIGTGDEDAECLLLNVVAADPRIQSVGGGSQKWRTAALIFTEDAVFWGSDNHAGSNAVYRYDRATGNVEVVGPVVGPVYYARTCGGIHLFGTTVEKGEGEQDGYGRLYALDPAGNLEEVFVGRKDLWPARFFGYGVYEFADGPGRNEAFWVTLRGFRGGLRSMLCRLTG